MTNIQSRNNDTRATIFYFNDLHGNVKGAKKIKTAADKFDAKYQTTNCDCFKFCAGDSYIGRTKNNFIGRFLNSLNLDGMTLGNHEFDMGSKQLSQFIDSIKCKIFAANIDYKKGNNFEDDLTAQRIVKSSVISKNGNQYGVIGVTAEDIFDTTSRDSQEDFTDIGFMNLDKTTQTIQDEVNKLKQQGINKIILISHSGIDNDKKLAQSLDGVDIIIGGHSHHSLDGVESKKNYFLSKSGEPVLIVQAGQNGEKYGELDVEFDKQGKLKSATNTLTSLKDYNPSLIVDYLENISFDKLEQLGELTSTVKKMKYSTTKEEHPLACFVADAMRIKSGAQIAFHNKGCQKTDLKAGKITNRDIGTALPYINSVSIYKFSEKDIIDAIKATLNEPKEAHSIGNIQISGMTYTITKDNKLKDVYITSGDNKIKLDENNPSTDKFYTVAYGAFFAGGPGALKMLYAPEKRIKKFDWDDQQATIELIKQRAVNGKIDIKADGRIKVEQ